MPFCADRSSGEGFLGFFLSQYAMFLLVVRCRQWCGGRVVQVAVIGGFGSVVQVAVVGGCGHFHWMVVVVVGGWCWWCRGRFLVVVVRSFSVGAVEVFLWWWWW